ncbi:radical SAM protein [Candidatus Gottesmanbacteria bacterium]|nr:radical SAM protein [Candidatus Gottesmanbacteria bacterium]
MPIPFLKKIFLESSYLTGQYKTQPRIISLVITNRCNFRCPSCSVWKLPFHNEMSVEDWNKILDNLSPITANTFVEINGGEALINKDLVVAIVKRLKNISCCVSLNSNGSLFKDKITNDLASAGLDYVKISLYSSNPNIHNKLRGFPMAYEKAIQAIQLIRNTTIHLQIGILITSENINYIPKLINHIRKTWPGSNIYLQALDESIHSPESKNLNTNILIDSLWPSANNSSHFFDYILQNPTFVNNSFKHLAAMKTYYLQPQSILKHRCLVGQTNIVLDPHGNVSFCFKRRFIGNVLKNNILDILNGKTAIQERKDIRTCPKYCRILGCNFNT